MRGSAYHSVRFKRLLAILCKLLCLLLFDQETTSQSQLNHVHSRSLPSCRSQIRAHQPHFEFEGLSRCGYTWDHSTISPPDDGIVNGLENSTPIVHVPLPDDRRSTAAIGAQVGQIEVVVAFGVVVAGAHCIPAWSSLWVFGKSCPSCSHEVTQRLFRGCRCFTWIS